MSACLLSVIIPTYNRALYLQILLDSLALQAAEQPAGLLEVVVVDNASTDETAEVCRQFAPRLPNFKYHCNERNLGAEGNALACPELAGGEWIWIFGDDDILLAGTVAEILVRLREAPFDVLLLNYAQSDREGRSVVTPKVVLATEDQMAARLRDLIPAYATFDVLGFLSSVIVRRLPLLAVDAKVWGDLQSFYGHMGRLLEAFSNRPAYFVAQPIVVQRQFNQRSTSDATTCDLTLGTGLALLGMFILLVERHVLTADEAANMRSRSGVGPDVPITTAFDWVIDNFVKSPFEKNLAIAMRPEVEFLWPIATHLPQGPRQRLQNIAALTSEAAALLRRYRYIVDAVHNT